MTASGEVRYTPLLEDVAAAMRLGLGPTPRRTGVGALLFGATFAVLTATGLLDGGSAGLAPARLGASAALGLCAAAAWFFLFPWLMRRLVASRASAFFAQNATFRNEWTVGWGPDGLHTANGRSDTRQPWTDFRLVREDAHVVLLYPTDLTFQLLPCRVLTPDHWRTLRPLLDQVPRVPAPFRPEPPPTADAGAA